MIPKQTQLLLDSIIDKLNGFEVTQKKVFIKMKPSSYFPGGKYVKGFVRFVHVGKNKVSLMDDREGPVDIYFSDIESPNDIEEAKS